MLPRGTTGPWVEQTAESEQDSESKTPSAVTQRGKTPSVTRGLLPSAQRGQSPHHPGPRDGGCVSHSVTGRSLSVTDISERPHLGTHSPPSGSAWDGHQWSHHSAWGQQQPKASPGLPCRAQRSGAATLRWASATRLGSVCAQSLLRQHRALGLAAGCTHGPGVREEAGTAHFLLGQVAAEPHAILFHEEITGSGGTSRATSSSSVIPVLTVAPPGDGKLPGERQEGNPGGTHQTSLRAGWPRAAHPHPAGLVPGAAARGSAQRKGRQGSSLGCDPPQQDDQQCPSP